MSKTLRIYGISCPQGVDMPDPISVFNAAGNCSMSRFRVAPNENHEYRIWCHGDYKKASSVKRTKDTPPMKVAPNPIFRTYVRTPDGWMRR